MIGKTKSTTSFSASPVAPAINNTPNGDSESTPNDVTSNQNVEPPPIYSSTAVEPIDLICSSTPATNTSIDSTSMNQDIVPLGDSFPADDSYSDGGYFPADNSCDGFDSDIDNEPLLVFHSIPWKPPPITPRPRSRVKRGQDELYRQWGDGSFDSSPMAPPPGFFERNREAIEKMCPLTRPTPYPVRKDYYRRLSRHAARRAARIGRNMLEEGSGR
jgi:hypothetical protein